MNIRKEITATAIVTPTVIGFCAFTLFPMLFSLVVSFTELHSYNVKYAEWTGISNYKFLLMVDLRSGWFGTSLKNIAIYILCVPFNLILAIFLANHLAKKVPGSKFMRVIMFMPQVVSGVAITMVFKWMFQEDFGMINTALNAIGLPKMKWTTDANTFSFGVFLLSVWMNGTNVIVLESGFLNVDKSIQEAARVDGASDMTVFWKITWPALTPTVFYLWTIWFVAGLQEQTVMQIISNNGTGPEDRALTPVYYIWKMAFQASASRGFGVACALSWLVAVGIMLLTRLNFFVSKFWVSEDF
ncbi:MAG: sugar ABC transporter permease [Candidatus Borkfalkiaceae bacterium]|nr:sugar ABC transporter permease [Clostridia bacterium]MDY6222758.1 sugar ABC transporter permease [Christensenellaceae bacterium]